MTQEESSSSLLPVASNCRLLYFVFRSYLNGAEHTSGNQVSYLIRAHDHAIDARSDPEGGNRTGVQPLSPYGRPGCVHFEIHTSLNAVHPKYRDHPIASYQQRTSGHSLQANTSMAIYSDIYKSPSATPIARRTFLIIFLASKVRGVSLDPGVMSIVRITSMWKEHPVWTLSLASFLLLFLLFCKKLHFHRSLCRGLVSRCGKGSYVCADILVAGSST